MKNKYRYLSFIIGITSLFIISAVAPLTIAYNLDAIERGAHSLYLSDFLQEKTILSLKIKPVKDIFQGGFKNGFQVSPWPMFGHDIRHTGRSQISTADNTGIMKWPFPVRGGIENSPIIWSDDTIYFGCCNYYGPLYALNKNGTEKWHFNTSDWILSTPAIADDGTIYFGALDKQLYALNPNGTLKWKFYTYDNVWSSPAIGEDGTVYFGILGPGYNMGRLYAVNPNGTEKWHYDVGDWIYASPAIDNDGIVYISSNDNHLYALYPNGTLKWSFTTEGWPGGPAIADDGTIYITSDYLYAVNPNGTMKWRSGISWGSGKTPSIAADGTIYAGEDKLFAFYPNGTQKWVFEPGENNEVSSRTHAISADGTIYFVATRPASQVEIIALNPDGTEKWEREIGNDVGFSSPTIGSDGTVYVGSVSITTEPVGCLYAFGELDPNAPSAPTISGPKTGKIGVTYDYHFTSVSPIDNDIYYYIDWGDGSSTDWIGPFNSGEEVTVNHTWSKQGTYSIQARSKDTSNLWGPWGTLQVCMPLNIQISQSSQKISQQSSNQLFFQLLKRLPVVSRINFLLVFQYHNFNTRFSSFLSSCPGTPDRAFSDDHFQGCYEVV